MPTYSYKCTSCGYAFDIHQSFSDASLTECPQCGQPLRKVFSPVGVTFKGSGFYRTDSRSASSGHKPSHSHSTKKSPEKAGASTSSTSDSSAGSSSTSSTSSGSSSSTASSSAPAATA